MRIFTKTYEISDDEFNFLLKIKNKSYAEFRDTEYNNLEEFKLNSSLASCRDDNYFLSRNFGGTYPIASKLYGLGFIEDVEDSWHITYKISELGLEVVEQLTSKQYIRNEKLEKLLS